MHHFNEESLAACYYELDGQKAVGHDGVDKARYGENLNGNLKDLVARMKRMAYKPAPVRQVLIPKEGKPGATRPLGISNFEDKLVQKMTQKVLESIYEPRFLNCSYGFRPNRSCHHAIRALLNHLYHSEVESVLDVDLANFFGTIDHARLLDRLRETIKDQRFIRYIARQFKAGILAKGELQISDEGVPQGSGCSPVLANIFAHYVIDVWFDHTVKQHCRGRVELFRYCDDIVICCQYTSDARRISQALKQRLEKFNLRLNEEKTQLVNFANPTRRDTPQPEHFDFLGFTFYWGRSRKGAPIPKLKTTGKRLRNKLKKVNQWGKAVRNRYSLDTIWGLFCRKLAGHINYYGVSHNMRAIRAFHHKATRILFKHLNRRSQRRSFDWERFMRYEALCPFPKPTIRHRLF